MRTTLHAAFRTALVIAVTAIFAVTPAFAENDDDGFHSLDSVDDGETRSLDSVDTGHTRSLDDADEGETVALDDADEGTTKSLDSVSTGRTRALDAVDTGRGVDLDAVNEDAQRQPAETAASAPIALPPIEDGDWEGQAERARNYVSAAEERLDFANQRYSNMLANDYPRGDARAAVIAERDTAKSALEQARAYLAQIGERAAAAGRPL